MNGLDDHLVNPDEKFRCVLSLQMGKFAILYSAEMDGFLVWILSVDCSGKSLNGLQMNNNVFLLANKNRNNIERGFGSDKGRSFCRDEDVEIQQKENASSI